MTYGSMKGQANHFFRYAPQKIQYGIDRYQNEARRLYSVLDKHLSTSKSGFLVGDRLTIADIANWGWVSSAAWAGIDLSDFKHLQDWEERLVKRPGFEKGRNVPEPQTHRGPVDPKKAEEAAKNASAWIMEGQKRDAQK